MRGASLEPGLGLFASTSSVTTLLSGGEGGDPPASPRASSTALPTYSSSTRPNAHTSSTCSARQRSPQRRTTHIVRAAADPSDLSASRRPHARHTRRGAQRTPRDSDRHRAIARCSHSSTPSPTPPARPGSSSQHTRHERLREWDTVANDTVAILREAGRDPTTETSSTSSDSSPPAATTSGSDGPPTRPHPRRRREALPPPCRWRPDCHTSPSPLARGPSPTPQRAA